MDGTTTGEDLQNDFGESSQFDEEETLISRSGTNHNSGNKHHIFKWKSVVRYTHVVRHVHSSHPANRGMWLSVNSGQPTVAHSKKTSRQFKNLFSSNRTSQPNYDCRFCQRPSLAFKHHGKSLLSFKNLLGFAFSAVAIPLSIAQAPALFIFVWNLIAIVPLSITLTYATESISKDLGETFGALLNISIGNLAELIILWVIYRILSNPYWLT